MRTWARSDLTGTRNGSNVNFTIPAMPDGAVAWIVYNGKLLFEVARSPDARSSSRTGAAVVVGLPPQADDTLWAYIVSEVIEEVPSSAVPLVQESRRTFYYNVEAFDKNGLRQEIIEKD